MEFAVEERAYAPRSWPGRLAAWLTFVLVISATAYASTFLGDDVPDDLLYRYSTAVGLVIQFLLFVAILLLITIRLPKRPMFGLTQPYSWRRALALGAGALVVVWALGAALSPLLDAGEEQGLLPDEWDSDRLWPFVAVGVSISVIGPIAEELMFRGVGYALLEPYGKWVAIVVTGLLFGAVHGLVVALPILAMFGIVLGWLRWKTESVYPCIVLHATFNAISIVSVPFVA
jgi:uncharacterized protein